ncbi:MAG: sigma 54-interacting transcriptional regulator [Victivallales bacterium]|nr:sigma 54-interacting transcriptional regulator [Victivallales bacterium]
MVLQRSHWESFLKNGANPGCRERIFKHWTECRARGIDPSRQTIETKAKPSAADSDAAKAFVQKVDKTLTPNLVSRNPLKLVFIACGVDGDVLKVYSPNDEMSLFLDSTKIKPQADFSGANFGTHAVSLAISSRQGAYCHRFEHYCSVFHDHITVASPIFSIEGDVVGYIGILAHHEHAKAQNLVMNLRLIIQSIDNKMRLKRLSMRHHRLQSLQDSLIECDDIPTMIVNSSGYLRQINPAAANLLGMNDGLKEKALDKLARFEPQIKTIAAVGMVQKDIKMTITLDDRKVRVTAASHPCYSEKDILLGVVVTMEEESSRKRGRAEQQDKAIYTFDDIIGTSPALNNAKQLARQISKSSISVLITGGSGTGKEMFAQSIHNESDFKDGPFVSINCSAIPRDLAESELFGHVRGAFTGALREGRVGKLEAADKGTIFLDEIADMPLELQGKLLRVLETKTLSRIGENRQRTIDLRLVAATNQDIKSLVAEKRFREDLYYRVAVSHIHLPSLNESKEDIPAIFMSFVEYFNERMGKKVSEVRPELLKLLVDYPWRGNIRELRNTAEYCVMMNPGDSPIAINHLPGDMRIPLLYPHGELANDNDPLSGERKNLETNEAELLRKAISMANGNMTKAAEILGVGRATLYRKIKKLRV